MPDFERVDWQADLGGGVRIALIQAGWFTTDAGTAFGPVPRIIWEPLVADELNPDSTLTQALNCLLVETPAGRVLVETGIGERLDERRIAQRGVRGLPILPALREAGFDPATIDAVAVSHLHWDHAGGFLTSTGAPAFPRARIVAAEGRVGLRPGRQPAARGVVRAGGAAPRRVGRPGRCRGRLGRAPPGRRGRRHRRPHRRPPGGRRAWPRSHGGLLRRPVHARLERQPPLGAELRRLPADERRRSRPRSSARRATRAGRSSCRTSHAGRSGASRPIAATASASSRPPDADPDAAGAFAGLCHHPPRNATGPGARRRWRSDDTATEAHQAGRADRPGGGPGGRAPDGGCGLDQRARRRRPLRAPAPPHRPDHRPATRSADGRDRADHPAPGGDTDADARVDRAHRQPRPARVADGLADADPGTGARAGRRAPDGEPEAGLPAPAAQGLVRAGRRPDRPRHPRPERQRGAHAARHRGPRQGVGEPARQQERRLGPGCHRPGARGLRRARLRAPRLRARDPTPCATRPGRSARRASRSSSSPGAAPTPGS